MHERNKVHLTRAAARAADREPTVEQYLSAARKMGVSADTLRTDLANKKAKQQANNLKQSRRERWQSAQEKQRAKGKPPASEWRVQSAKGGAFCLVHRESGDFYADYVSTPSTSWGAKRFVTVDEAYKYLNDPKFFTQGRSPQTSWNQSKSRGDKVQERVRKQMGFA
jgi:hypothetical protein